MDDSEARKGSEVFARFEPEVIGGGTRNREAGSEMMLGDEPAIWF
jgi:hypothetical protein